MDILELFIEKIRSYDGTIKELAYESGVGENTILNWVNRKFVPTMNTAAMVANALGIEFTLIEKRKANKTLTC